MCLRASPATKIKVRVNSGLKIHIHTATATWFADPLKQRGIKFAEAVVHCEA
jgi:hypothetical protein